MALPSLECKGERLRLSGEAGGRGDDVLHQEADPAQYRAVGGLLELASYPYNRRIGRRYRWKSSSDDKFESGRRERGS